MPAKATPSKKKSSSTTTPSKKKTVSDDAVDKLATGMSNMSVSASFQPFKMTLSFPYMIKNYYKDGRKACTVDFYVHTQDISTFRVGIAKGGKVLELGMVIPEWFGEEDRIKASKRMMLPSMKIPMK